MQTAEVLFRAGLTLKINDARKCIKMYYTQRMNSKCLPEFYLLGNDTVLSFESQRTLRRKLVLAVCIMLVSCFGYSETLKMKNTFYAETSDDFGWI
jgi:hypothetical protein